MFPETERSMSLRRRIASGYFERALARELSDQFRIGNVEKHIRPFRVVRLFLHCAIQRLLDAIADLCLSKARIVYLQDRDRICAVPSIILNYADAGLRCPKDFETAVVLVFEVIYFVDLPEHSMVFDISQVIRLAERLIFVPRFPSLEQAHRTARQGMQCFRTRRIHPANLQQRPFRIGQRLEISRKEGAKIRAV